MPSSVLGGVAFSKLPEETKQALFEQLRTRRIHYELAKRRGYNGGVRAVLLGDKPGPGRPTATGYHHTPFYSTKHTSLWLNLMLLEEKIDENRLLWFNVESADGQALNPIHIQDLRRLHPVFICMGGEAEKWMKKNAPGVPYTKVFHPSFAKRFQHDTRYNLLDVLKEAVR